eukprot:gnl/TRDRNA2_/TRDRNA2_86725_c0_seq2.p1 gnl/TRDRNA2_/TRDRNA2_86725_c0~~gnl/TRDRNA2_/TRDRNA2_86725_c0_seq2.p1  ORF type:complete len:560 (-),score=77.85 gnl/TRDRNA2_/TRDRNA2_86725_c0_seq2:46-1725(-)
MTRMVTSELAAKLAVRRQLLEPGHGVHLMAAMQCPVGVSVFKTPAPRVSMPPRSDAKPPPPSKSVSATGLLSVADVSHKVESPALTGVTTPSTMRTPRSPPSSRESHAELKRRLNVSIAERNNALAQAHRLKSEVGKAEEEIACLRLEVRRMQSVGQVKRMQSDGQEVDSAATTWWTAEVASRSPPAVHGLEAACAALVDIRSMICVQRRHGDLVGQPHRGSSSARVRSFSEPPSFGAQWRSHPSVDEQPELKLLNGSSAQVTAMLDQVLHILQNITIPAVSIAASGSSNQVNDALPSHRLSDVSMDSDYDLHMACRPAMPALRLVKPSMAYLETPKLTYGEPSEDGDQLTGSHTTLPPPTDCLEADGDTSLLSRNGSDARCGLAWSQSRSLGTLTPSYDHGRRLACTPGVVSPAPSQQHAGAAGPQRTSPPNWRSLGRARSVQQLNEACVTPPQPMAKRAFNILAGQRALETGSLSAATPLGDNQRIVHRSSAPVLPQVAGVQRISAPSSSATVGVASSASPGVKAHYPYSPRKVDAVASKLRGYPTPQAGHRILRAA